MQVIRPVDISGTVVVTGAARGIGLATAKLALAAGAQVAFLDSDEEALQTALASADGDKHSAIALHCDVAVEDDIQSAVARIVDSLGPPTGLVAAAGIDHAGLVHELPTGVWDEVIAVNLRGAFLTARAVLPHLIEAESGSIVLVSSPLAFAGVAGSSAYSASKGAISAMTRTLAVDYGRFGIRVNALLPGPTDTDLMWANVPTAEVDATRQVVESEVPLGRLADPTEPAHAAVWLLSPASSFVTGSQLVCDGGVLARASISV